MAELDDATNNFVDAKQHIADWIEVIQKESFELGVEEGKKLASNQSVVDGYEEGLEAGKMWADKYCKLILKHISDGGFSARELSQIFGLNFSKDDFDVNKARLTILTNFTLAEIGTTIEDYLETQDLAKKESSKLAKILSDLKLNYTNEEFQIALIEASLMK